jgi:hypothetical protein
VLVIPDLRTNGQVSPVNLASGEHLGKHKTDARLVAVDRSAVDKPVASRDRMPNGIGNSIMTGVIGPKGAKSNSRESDSFEPITEPIIHEPGARSLAGKLPGGQPCDQLWFAGEDLAPVGSGCKRCQSCGNSRRCLIGNLLIAAGVGHLRGLLTRPETLKRINQTCGILLIVVGLVIAFL